jgi:D-threo-aldose 1-dehydrogenase
VTAFSLPRIGLGCATLGNLGRAMTDADADAVLEAAWDRGIRLYDTAPHYGLGLSERRLGRFLAGGPRDEFMVSTKVGRLLRERPGWAGEADDEGFAVPGDRIRVWDFSDAGIRSSLAQSCDRLQVDAVDILHLHDPERHDLAAAIGSGVTTLASLRGSGMVRAIGVGSMDADAVAAVASTGALDVVMVAGRYTLLDQSMLRAAAPVCARTNTQIIVASVFNSGLLAGPLSAEATFDYRAAPPDMIEKARRIEAVCVRHGTDLATVALHYPLRHPLVRSVVIGAQSPRHVHENMDRLARRPPESLWEELTVRALIPRLPDPGP